MIKQKLLLLLAAPALSLVLVQAQPRVEIFPGGGYLGVQIRDVSSEDAQALGLPREAGVYVQGVDEGSPAERAGIHESDVITEFSGVPVLSVAQFRRLVSETPPDREVDLRLWRGGNSAETTARIEKRRLEGGAGRGFRLRLPDTEDFSFELPDFESRGDGARRGFILGRSRPRLGIQGVELGEQMAQFLGIPNTSGVLVLEVLKESPAEKAGLQAGDVITGIDGKNVTSLAELSDRVRGGSSNLNIIRDKRRQDLTITLEPERRESSGENRRL
jgi:serine protease Do